MVRVVMLQHARGLNPGEVAGFSEEEAAVLIRGKSAKSVPDAAVDLDSIVGSLSNEARALLMAKFDQEVALAKAPLRERIEQLESELAETKAALSKLEHPEPPKSEEPPAAETPVEPPPPSPEPAKVEEKAETKPERRRR